MRQAARDGRDLVNELRRLTIEAEVHYSALDAVLRDMEGWRRIVRCIERSVARGRELAELRARKAKAAKTSG